MMRLPALAILVLSLMACASSGSPAPGSVPQGGACTTLGCTDGLQVALAPDAKWPAGSYRIELDADGSHQTCTAVLPLKACEAGPTVQCTGASLARIGESGCALQPGEHGLSDIQFSSSPKKVHVRITRDGASRGEAAVIADQELTPEYRRLQPNGPDCEPVCNSASARISLAF